MLAVLQSYRGDCDAVTSFLQKGIDRAISNCMDSPALHQVHGSLAVQVLRVILFAILISVDTTLRGISQVFLCNNPISGIFIFVGLCISTDVQLGPLALLGSFAGFCGGMTALLVHMLATSDQAPANDEPPAAQQLYVDDEANMDLLSGNISASSPPAAATPVESPQPAQRYLFSPFSDALHNGLYGYDGALVACGTRVFLSTLLVEVSASASDNTVAGDLGIVYAVGALLGFICGAARGGISRGINKAFGLPTLTLTFNMVILLSLYALGGPSSAFLDTKQTVVTAASSASSASAESQLASVSCCLSASSLCNRSALPIPNAVEETEIAFESFTNALIQARCSALRGGTIISEGWVMGASSATTVLPALAAASATASPLLFDDTDPALLDISSGDWAKAIVLGVSQFMFVDTLEGGILVLIGILFATATGCALAVLGSIVSLLSATFLIKLSYRKTSWFASRASLAAATVSESPLKLQSSSVKVFASSICPTQSIGAPSEFSTICIPIAKASVFSVSASPVTSKSVPWTVPVGSVRNGLAGYNGGGLPGIGCRWLFNEVASLEDRTNYFRYPPAA